MKTLLLVGVLLMLTTAGYAQAVNVPGQDKKGGGPGDDSKLKAERDAVDLAKQRGKNGDVTGVEQVVTILNEAKANTAEWHLETAQRLLLTAESLARDGQGAPAAALAQRAIQNLAQAEAKAKDDPTKAAARTLAGFIQERYLADPVAAIASYEAAAQLAPTEAKGAKAAADRLRHTDENQRNKTPDKLKEKIDKGDKDGGGHG